MPRRGKGEGSIVKRSSKGRVLKPHVGGVQLTPQEKRCFQPLNVQMAHCGQHHRGHLKLWAWPTPVAVHAEGEHRGLQSRAFVSIYEGMNLNKVKNDRGYLSEEGGVSVFTPDSLKRLGQGRFQRPAIAQARGTAGDREDFFMKLKHRLRRRELFSPVAPVETVLGHRLVLREDLQRLFVFFDLLLHEALHFGVRQLTAPSCLLGFGCLNPEHAQTKDTTGGLDVAPR